MTDKQVLETAIQRAVDNGWKGYKYENANKEAARYIPDGYVVQERLLFNHEFAKALWTDKPVHYYDIVDLDNGGTTETVTMPMFHYHLKQLAVAEDRIAYLREYLENTND